MISGVVAVVLDLVVMAIAAAIVAVAVVVVVVVVVDVVAFGRGVISRYRMHFFLRSSSQ